MPNLAPSKRQHFETSKDGDFLPLRALCALCVRQENLLATPRRSAGFPARSKLRPPTAPAPSNFQFSTCNLKLLPDFRVLSVSALNLPLPKKNVEKLSFQARLNCLYRQLKNFLTTPKFYISPPSSASWRSASSTPLPLFPWRPPRLGALQKMREAFLSPLGDFVSLVRGSFSPSLSVPSVPCVVKLSHSTFNP